MPEKLEDVIARSTAVPEIAKPFVTKYISPAASVTYRGLGVSNDTKCASYSDCTSFTIGANKLLPGFEQNIQSAVQGNKFLTNKPWSVSFLLNPSLDGAADYRVDFIDGAGANASFIGRLPSGQPIIQNLMKGCYGQGFNATATPVPIGTSTGLQAPLITAQTRLGQTSDSAWAIAAKFRVISSSLTITQDATSLTDSGTVFSAPIGNSYQRAGVAKPQVWNTADKALASQFYSVGTGTNTVANDPFVVPVYAWRSALPTLATGDLASAIIPQIMNTPQSQSRPLKGEGGGEYAIYRATDFDWQDADPCVVANPLANGLTWPDTGLTGNSPFLIANSGGFRTAFAPAMGAAYQLIVINNIDPAANIVVKAISNIDVVADIGSPFQPFSTYAPHMPALVDALASQRPVFDTSYPHSYNLFGWLASAASKILPIVGRVARSIINPATSIGKVVDAATGSTTREQPIVKEVVRVEKSPPQIVRVPVAVKPAPTKTKKVKKTKGPTVVSTKLRRGR